MMTEERAEAHAPRSLASKGASRARPWAPETPDGDCQGSVAAPAKPRIVSNVAFETALAEHIDLCRLDPVVGSRAGLLAYWRRAVSLWKQADVAFFEASHREVMIWCLVASLIRGTRCKLVCADLMLPRPVSVRDRMAAAVTRVLLRRVDLFLLLQKDVSAYERYYRLDRAKIVHVPFKTNYLEMVKTFEPSEGDYYWSGGTTYRDWDTLAQAIKGLDIRMVMTVPDDDELRRRGESDSAKRQRRGIPPVVPPPGLFDGSQVRIVRHGADPRTWLAWVAGAKGVILPIHPRSISPSGISTSMTAMALRKPLIISEGASTVGLLDEATAVVVPPGDPDALRKAILRLDGSPDLRRQLATAGHRHALAAGDTSRLHTDYLRHLIGLATGAQPPSSTRPL